MPVQVEITDDVLVLRMQGFYEPADIRAALLAGLDDAPAQSLRGLLFDVRASEVLVDRPTEQVREMARFLAGHGRRFGDRLALLADADYAYGLMRLGSVFVEQAGVATSVFREEAEALRWLRHAVGNHPPESPGEGR